MFVSRLENNPEVVYQIKEYSDLFLMNSFSGCTENHCLAKSPIGYSGSVKAQKEEFLMPPLLRLSPGHMEWATQDNSGLKWNPEPAQKKSQRPLENSEKCFCLDMYYCYSSTQNASSPRTARTVSHIFISYILLSIHFAEWSAMV